ncbi:MAG: peptidoglycan DD-metalloendopeptidase family protein [Hespellia sp.]|nr:peptidoglycan DD-metalloendopeptidase family protein [Hespellia sp.]
MVKRKRRALSAMMVMVLSISMGLNAGATSISDAEKKAGELESQKSAVEAEKASLTDQINKITTQMTDTQTKIETKREEVTKAEDNLISAKVAENTQYENMKLRIKYMYESGNTQFVEMLVESKNLAELVSTAEYVSQMSSYDRGMLTEFQDTVAEVTKQEDSLKKEYNALTGLQDTLVTQQAEVQAVLDENNVKLADLESQIGENAATLAQLQKEAEAAAAAAAEAAAAAASGGGGSSFDSSSVVVSGNGEFTNPCPGASYISSEFGEYRSESDPAHKGMDFAASTGTPTYAAAAGTVLIANYSSSAGNWVVIDHGNGIVTKYMHHSAICVSAGQTVSKGQQIGAVGTTGYSTGPHLHFQVELNGSAVNPRNYL